MKARAATFGDFRCGHCGAFVSSAQQFSGVNNRNHCPYCLWSRHLDLFASGDRLSACKAEMKPVGLTLKKSRNKYQPEARGELMLVHECTDCRTLSINRIAADDNAASAMTIFQESLRLDPHIRMLFQENEILLLDAGQSEHVRRQLYGHALQAPALSWS